MTYSYHDGDNYVFMDTNTGDQIYVAKEKVGDEARFLSEGLDIEVTLFNGNPIGVELPPNVVMQVVASEPGIAAMIAHHDALYADLADPVALLRGERDTTALGAYWPYATGEGARLEVVFPGARAPALAGGRWRDEARASVDLDRLDPARGEVIFGDRRFTVGSLVTTRLVDRRARDATQTDQPKRHVPEEVLHVGVLAPSSLRATTLVDLEVRRLRSARATGGDRCSRFEQAQPTSGIAVR